MNLPFALILLTFIIESESQQYLKLLRFTPRSAAFHPATEFSKYPKTTKAKTQQRHSIYPQISKYPSTEKSKLPYTKISKYTHHGHGHHAKPHHNDLYINNFISEYKHNIQLLKVVDPCIFNPCGANTFCEENYYHSSRTCYCHHGYIPHPKISETCVRPCDLYDCGEHATCVDGVKRLEHDCVCNPGYLPILHGTSRFKGCADPCQDMPCNPLNTICIPQSAGERECICQQGTVPIDGDADENGCEYAAEDPCIVNPCNALNTVCIAKSTDERYCLCNEGTGPINGDAAENGCMENPCSLEDACGPNTFCVQMFDFTKMCICKPGFTVEDPKTEDIDGCEGYPEDRCKVGSYLYTVHTDQDLARDAAKMFCEMQGGYLPEPPPTIDGIQQLLDDIQDTTCTGIFDDNDACETFWVGAIGDTNNPFDAIYETSGMFISSNNEIFSTAQDGAMPGLTVCSGTDGFTNAALATQNHVICQYNIPS